MLSKLLLHFRLSDGDQFPHIFGGGVPEVHHNVRVNVGDLGVAVAKSFESNLIDQSAGTHTFDFLEDRASARMVLEPGMLAAAPAQVLLHDAMHDCLIAALELERHRERDFPSLV